MKEVERGMGERDGTGRKESERIGKPEGDIEKGEPGVRI